MTPPVDIWILLKALRASWDSDTSVAGIRLPAGNPARGQCEASSLVVQDHYGGELIRLLVQGEDINENHYCVLLERPYGSLLIDATHSQYTEPIRMEIHPDKYVSRESRLGDAETLARYQILKRRVDTLLDLT